jgi:uncharacterized protein YfdQ (DUF2303 family)
MTNNSQNEPSGAAAVLADLADQAASREPLDINTDRAVFVLRRDDQTIEEFGLEGFQDKPYRQHGTVYFTDAQSLIAYLARFDLSNLSLWANSDKGRIEAVINDHQAKTPQWGDHRGIVSLRQTEDWKHWLSQDGKYLGQQEFAEHIEDGLPAITRPAAADMLEVAQSLQAKSGVQIKSTKRLGGEIEFAYEETATAKAGQTGKLEVPDTFDLALAPYDGTPPADITARLRWRLANGQLLIGYRLIRPAECAQAAFDALTTMVGKETGTTVMNGTPRAS